MKLSRSSQVGNNTWKFFAAGVPAFDQFVHGCDLIGFVVTGQVYRIPRQVCGITCQCNRIERLVASSRSNLMVGILKALVGPCQHVRCKKRDSNPEVFKGFEQWKCRRRSVLSNVDSERPLQGHYSSVKHVDAFSKWILNIIPKQSINRLINKESTLTNRSTCLSVPSGSSGRHQCSLVLILQPSKRNRVENSSNSSD